MLSANTQLAGRYIILKKIGQGGMAAVYQAADSRIPGKWWAVKEMSDAAIADPQAKQQAVQRFQQEAQMLALLNHPNLPNVSDYFSEAGRQYLVMEFIEGETLQALLDRHTGPLSERQVVDWGVQLCDVLDYLHSQQPPIIFRDLKPANIMLDKGGRVKLIDFGIVRHFNPAKASDTIPFGSPGYAPPEQYGKGQTDASSDIYALGATLHQLLTGHDPAQTPFQFPPISSLNPLVSPDVEQAVMRALEQSPAARWPSAREMRQALLHPAEPSQPTQVGKQIVICPRCGQVNDAAEIYCQSCLHQLAGSRFCPRCGDGIPTNSRFCPDCGSRV